MHTVFTKHCPVLINSDASRVNKRGVWFTTNPQHRLPGAASPAVQVYVHNWSVAGNRTRFLYTAWRDGAPLLATEAVDVVEAVIDDKAMSARMGHAVEVTKGESV